MPIILDKIFIEIYLSCNGNGIFLKLNKCTFTLGRMSVAGKTFFFYFLSFRYDLRKSSTGAMFKIIHNAKEICDFLKKRGQLRKQFLSFY